MMTCKEALLCYARLAKSTRYLTWHFTAVTTILHSKNGILSYCVDSLYLATHSTRRSGIITFDGWIT